MRQPPPTSPLFPYTTLFRSPPAVVVITSAEPSALPDSAIFQRSPRMVRRVFRKPIEVEKLRSEEHTSELQSRQYLVCRLLLEKKKDHGQVQRESSDRPPDHR